MRLRVNPSALLENDDGDDNAAAKGALSGSITWSDGKHLVRSPFVVTS